MTALRMLPGKAGEGHQGEVFCCAFEPDGTFVLSGGWDGHLRLWDVTTGGPTSALQVGAKAISACAVAPDGATWLSGSMEGLFTAWDPISHQIKQSYVAHIRPVSCICFSPDGRLVATSSWDRQVAIRLPGKEREGRTLNGHTDIVAGCQFTPDGRHLLSWSHDLTLRLWETESGRCAATFKGHKDRVVWASISRDGHWAASVARDGGLKLWDLQTQSEAARAKEEEELRACFFLLDAASLVTADAAGGLLVLSVPDLEVQSELAAGIAILCGDLSPSGSVLALGAEDGRVRFVAVDGMEEAPLFVPARQSRRPAPSMLGRLLGKNKMATAYQYTCPTCRATGEVRELPPAAIPCPKCRRPLRLDAPMRQLQPQS